MKKLANVTGAKALGKNEQKSIKGSRKEIDRIDFGRLCGIFPHFVVCLPLETCIDGKCYAL